MNVHESDSSSMEKTGICYELLEDEERNICEDNLVINNCKDTENRKASPWREDSIQLIKYACGSLIGELTSQQVLPKDFHF